MKTFPKNIAFLAAAAAALFSLSACTKRVTAKTDPGTLSDSGKVGYVAFRYEAFGRESAELYIRHLESKKTYRFSLDQAPSSFYASAGPFRVYEKLFADSTPPLTLIPLPAGDYECRYLYARIPFSPWMAFLLQTGEAQIHQSFKGKMFSIGRDTVTYIGTYQASGKARPLAFSKYNLVTMDTGDTLAVQTGLQKNFRKSIVALE